MTGLQSMQQVVAANAPGIQLVGSLVAAAVLGRMLLQVRATENCTYIIFWLTGPCCMP
jgi:hypothetical protein